MKKQLIANIAAALHSFGYQVYVAKGGEHGFYTDGKQVVSFGGHWSFSVDFTGNYRALTAEAGRSIGTGWQIAKELSSITEEQAEKFINAGAPTWAVRRHPFKMTTPEEHLKTYGNSSGYTLYVPPGEPQ